MTALDKCDACGVPDTNLFSGWFGPDDLASDGRQKGDRWTTFCNVCGAEQGLNPPVKPSRLVATHSERPAQAKPRQLDRNGDPAPVRRQRTTRVAEVGAVVQHRVARETGATVTVERTGPGSWIEQEPGWMTICLNHGTCCLHTARLDAEAHAATPSGWCGDCRMIVEGKRPRITTGKVT